MKHHRFLVDFPLDTGENGVLKNKEQVHQLEAVFRLRKGDQVIFFNENGDDFRVVLENIEKNRIGFRVQEKIAALPFPKRRVTLACAIIKRDNFEWVVQKTTEIGVTEIIPLVTDASVKLGFSLPRIKKIMREAVEQCGRSSVPDIHETAKFEDVLKERKNKYFFDSGEKFFGKYSLENDITLFVGPEGGWSQREKILAAENGAKIASLGTTVLRSETAATVAVFEAVNS